MSTVSSSSEESDKDKKKKKTKTKKKDDKKTKKKDKTKKGKAKGKKKEKKGKDKKRKAVSSGSSSSSSSSRGKKKVKKKHKGESAEAPNAWVAGRLREIRRTEPDLPPHEAMKKAQEEYSAIFSGGSGKCEALDAGPGALEDASNPCVQRANQEAKEVEDAQRAAGKSEEEAKAAGAEAKDHVLQIAARSGLYKPPEAMPLFMREQLRRQNEAVRLSVLTPSTGNARKEALE